VSLVSKLYLRNVTFDRRTSIKFVVRNCSEIYSKQQDVSTERRIRRIHDDSSVLGCYAMSIGRQLQKKPNAFMYRINQYSFWNAWPWKRRRYVPSDLQQRFISWYSITSQKTWIFSKTAVRTSNFDVMNFLVYFRGASWLAQEVLVRVSGRTVHQHRCSSWFSSVLRNGCWDSN